jgi:hypothetical protein
VLGVATVLTALPAALLPVQGQAAWADPEPAAPGTTAPPTPSPSPSASPATLPPSPSAVPSAPAPGPVRALAWHARKGAARLTWDPPAGAPAGTTYSVLVRAGGSADRRTGTATPLLIVSPVAPGARLTATVTATADGVAGPTTAAPSWVEPATPPEAPSSAVLAAVAGSSALRVTWTPSVPADGPALTGFVVELRTVAEPAVVAALRSARAGARAVDFRGLEPGIRYFATVAAVSPAGTGAERETATAVPRATTSSACASCAAPVAQPPVASRGPAPAATAAAAPTHPAATAAGSPVPVSSAMPLHLALGIAGILLAACLAIAAVLLRRRSALG